MSTRASQGRWLLGVALEARGLSAAEVDRRCGFGDGSNTTARYLRGERTPSLDEALVLERVLGIAVSAWRLAEETTQ